MTLSNNRSREKRANRIKEILPNTKSLEDLCSQVNIAPITVYSICMEYGINLDGLQAWRYNPKIDALIDQDLSLREMSKMVGISYEAVRQYILASLQHPSWMERKLH